MPKVSPIQNDFSNGEFSPLLYGRSNIERYRSALAICENYCPMIQGPITRRPGTTFVNRALENDFPSRLQAFEFSTTQAYMLEFAYQKIRFYKNNAIITETAKNITGATAANPAVITSNGHGYSNGDRVIITGVVGMTELNNREFTVAGVTANTFQLSGVNSTAYTAYVSGGTVAKVYMVSSPYIGTEVFDLKFTQSADVLYITHPSYAPRTLTRTGHTSWTLAAITFTDGPYLAVSSPYTLSPSAATGSVDLVSGPAPAITNATSSGGLILITANSHGFTTGQRVGIDGVTGTTEANGSWIVTVVNANTFTLDGSTFTNAYVANGVAYPGVFLSTDVGRQIRMLQGGVWGFGRITAFSHYGKVTFSVESTLTSTAAKSTWRFGLWSDTTGYPAAVVFHEDRLFFAGAANFPQRIDGSVSGNYTNFAPSTEAGTVTDSHAVSFTLNSNDVNAVHWMVSDEKALLCGSRAGEWVVKAAAVNEALSPTNIQAKRVSSYGSLDISALQAGKSVIFVQKAGRTIRELRYFFQEDGFDAPQLSVLAEHITLSGIRQMAYQREPNSAVWLVREDGVLLSMTYERDSDALKVGFARHILGGTSDAHGNDAVVESVAVIPSLFGTRDEVWVSVKRYINGATIRYIEYINKFFEDDDELKDAKFLDSALTYDAPVTIVSATKANPVVINGGTHGLANGDRILISGVSGMTELNGNTYTVANVVGASFELSGVNGTAYGTFIPNGGVLRKYVSTITGLGHLEGETIQVLGDGAVQADVTVSGGRVTLAESATTIQLGYAYDSKAQMLRIDAGAADGTAIGKTRRTHRVGFMFHRSLGFVIGENFTNMKPIFFRTTSDPLSRAVPLFSGIKSVEFSSTYDFENMIAWKQSQPLPGTILAVMPQMVTQDRG